MCIIYDDSVSHQHYEHWQEKVFSMCFPNTYSRLWQAAQSIIFTSWFCDTHQHILQTGDGYLQHGYRISYKMRDKWKISPWRMLLTFNQLYVDSKNMEISIHVYQCMFIRLSSRNFIIIHQYLDEGNDMLTCVIALYVFYMRKFGLITSNKHVLVFAPGYPIMTTYAKGEIYIKFISPISFWTVKIPQNFLCKQNAY